MLLYIIRHGNPDYEHDNLTVLGRKQAAALAKSLRDTHFDKLFASSYGRAQETASYTAKIHKMDVEIHDFMRELDWGGEHENSFDNGHPWGTVAELMRCGRFPQEESWRDDPLYKPSMRLKNCLDERMAALDAFLEMLGYTREGKLYRCTRKNEDVYAIFCHEGATSMMLAHLLNIPFPQVCAQFHIFQTSISCLSFQAEPNRLITPRIECLNQVTHLALEDRT